MLAAQREARVVEHEGDLWRPGDEVGGLSQLTLAHLQLEHQPAWPKQPDALEERGVAHVVAAVRLAELRPGGVIIQHEAHAPVGLELAARIDDGLCLLWPLQRCEANDGTRPPTSRRHAIDPRDFVLCGELAGGVHVGLDVYRLAQIQARQVLQLRCGQVVAAKRPQLRRHLQQPPVRAWCTVVAVRIRDRWQPHAPSSHLYLCVRQYRT